SDAIRSRSDTAPKPSDDAAGAADDENGLRAIRRADGAKHRAHMDLDRVVGQPELLGDHAVAATVDEQAQHFALPPGHSSDRGTGQRGGLLELVHMGIPDFALVPL